MSYICSNCFTDPFLIDFIDNNGSINDCDYCGEKKINCVDLDDLIPLFDNVIKLYDFVENFMPTDGLKEYDDGEYIWEKLQEDWNIFTSDDPEDYEEIIRDMYKSSDPKEFDKIPLDSWWEDSDAYFGISDEINERIKAYWEEFKEEIKHQRRFFPKSNFDINILHRILPHITNEDFKATVRFSRARKCTRTIIDIDKMGKPPDDKATAGRANPPGIAYLYLASNIKTCIAEVRPDLLEYITVGSFVCKADLKLIDLRSIDIKSPFQYGEDIGIVLEHLNFLKILGEELSKPVSKADSIYEYLPTQYLCEYFKNQGLDGVLYTSSISNDGYNLVLFEENKVDCVDTTLFQVTTSTLTYVAI